MLLEPRFACTTNLRIPGNHMAVFYSTNIQCLDVRDAMDTKLNNHLDGQTRESLKRYKTMCYPYHRGMAMLMTSPAMGAPKRKQWRPELLPTIL